jgi:hypothetical protein
MNSPTNRGLHHSAFRLYFMLMLSIPSTSISLFSKAATLSSPSIKTETKKRRKWTVMMYIQAKNNLSAYAGQNLKEIAMAESSPHVSILAQWEQPRQKGAWRYKISKHNVSLENYSEVKDPKNAAQKLIDFVKWGAETNPADHYCIILWNHGTGVLNPPFGNPLKVLTTDKELMSNPRIDMAGFLQSVDSRNKKRGILFDDENKAFLGNGDMRAALRAITSEKILGKKIDCLGFDACYMGGLEIAYDVRKYAKYMIASEELELARGWHYSSFIPTLISTLPTPEGLAKNIVSTYGDFYKGRTCFYTQSAMNLAHIDKVKTSLDDTVVNMGICLKHHKTPVLKAIRRARNSCQQFSTRVYVDLHSFCTKFLARLTTEENVPSEYREGLAHLERRSEERRTLKEKKIDSPQISALVRSLKKTIFTLEESIIERVCSERLSGARGLSIYFPTQSSIDFSYQTSIFGQESLWSDFIEELTHM